MKKLLILLIMFITIVYCSNCTIGQQHLVTENDSATLQQGHTKKVSDTQYRSDVPIWLLRSI